MRERHEREIEELQENCPHPADQRSDWMEMCWAPAHSSGYFVKECKLCGEIMEKSDPETTVRLYKEEKEALEKANKEWRRKHHDSTDR